MNVRILVLLAVLIPCGTASAQFYSGDARKIAMGGVGYSDNIAEDFIEEENAYRSVVLPLGLIQMARDFDKFDPDDEETFDPMLLLGYVANPIHLGFDRDTNESLRRFVTDIINADLDLDLNTYRGIPLTNHLEAEGLMSHDWGLTIKPYRKKDGSFHGFFVGAGPYVSARTNLDIDEELTDVLNSPVDVPIPNREFEIYNQSGGQLAMSITGGYRGRISISGEKSGGRPNRNGVYLAMDYHYLLGFHYDDMNTAFRLDTDSEGLLTMSPETTPLDFTYTYSRSGRGFAMDFGVGVVLDGWEFGFGAKGVANRIDWEDLTRKRYTLESVLDGGDLIEEWIPLPDRDLRVELPVQYTGHAGYSRKRTTVAVSVSQGFQDTAVHCGAEYRLGIIDVRGGMRYALDKWHPTMGVGLNLGRVFSIDAAAFWNTTNIERAYRPNLAVSLRFNKPSGSGHETGGEN